MSSCFIVELRLNEFKIKGACSQSCLALNLLIIFLGDPFMCLFLLYMSYDQCILWVFKSSVLLRLQGLLLSNHLLEFGQGVMWYG